MTCSGTVKSSSWHHALEDNLANSSFATRASRLLPFPALLTLRHANTCSMLSNITDAAPSSLHLHVGGGTKQINNFWLRRTSSASLHRQLEPKIRRSLGELILEDSETGRRVGRGGCLGIWGYSGKECWVSHGIWRLSQQTGGGVAQHTDMPKNGQILQYPLQDPMNGPRPVWTKQHQRIQKVTMIQEVKNSTFDWNPRLFRTYTYRFFFPRCSACDKLASSKITSRVLSLSNTLQHPVRIFVSRDHFREHRFIYPRSVKASTGRLTLPPVTTLTWAITISAEQPWIRNRSVSVRGKKRGNYLHGR